MAATIDTWGNRGTTWVTQEEEEVTQPASVNMISALQITSKDVEDICPPDLVASDTSEDFDRGDSNTEYEDTSPMKKTNNLNLHTIAYGNLSESEERIGE